MSGAEYCRPYSTPYESGPIATETIYVSQPIDATPQQIVEAFSMRYGAMPVEDDTIQTQLNKGDRLESTLEEINLTERATRLGGIVTAIVDIAEPKLIAIRSPRDENNGNFPVQPLSWEVRIAALKEAGPSVVRLRLSDGSGFAGALRRLGSKEREQAADKIRDEIEKSFRELPQTVATHMESLANAPVIAMPLDTPTPPAEPTWSSVYQRGVA